MVMQALEVLGLVTLVGLLFTAERRNNGVSQFINSVGNAHKSIVQGIGPG